MKRRYTYIFLALVAGLSVYAKRDYDMLYFYVTVAYVIMLGIVIEFFQIILEEAEDIVTKLKAKI